MITKRKNTQNEMTMVILEDLVPKDHLLRKIDASINFSFIYELVEPLYANCGRPSVDPVILFKLMFINHLYGYNSMRRTIAETEVHLAYRWFIGYGIEDKIPHFSDFSKNYTRRFNQDIDMLNPLSNKVETMSVCRAVFIQLLSQINDKNFLYPAHIYMDSTHIKANANKRKVAKIEILKEVRHYQDELDAEVDSYCKENNLSIPKPVERELVEVTQCISDPEAGIFVKGEHERQVAYTAQTICDINGFVLDTELAPANKHDSTTFYTPYHRVVDTFGVGGEKGIRSIGLDSGYKTAFIAHRIIEDKITPLFPYTRPKGQRNKDGYTKKDFKYDKAADVYHCPNGNQLTPRSVNRKSGAVTYQCSSKDCANCPFRNICLSKTSKCRSITRSVWEDDIDEVELIRKTEYHQRYYPLRKETIERVFADGKETWITLYPIYRTKKVSR